MRSGVARGGDVMFSAKRKTESSAVELIAEPRLENMSTAMTVETVGTHIYFYSAVDSDRCLALVKSLREVDNQLCAERIARNIQGGNANAPIWLHIMSGGGDLFAALSVADQIKTISTPVYSIVEGYAASAATIISMACHKRFIMPSAFFLVHQLSSVAWGKFSDLQDEMHILGMLMDTITEFYADHSRLSKKRVLKLLKRDSWFNAVQALELGFVDTMGVG